MILGTASIPAIYLLGRTISNSAVGLSAAAILAVSYHHIWFSQNARGYSGLMLATTLSTWCFVEGQKHSTWWRWVLYAVIVALGAYMHLTMVFVAVSHAIIVVGLGIRDVWQRRPINHLIRPCAGIVLSGVLTIALYGPMMSDLVSYFVREGKRLQSEYSTISWAVRETIQGLQQGFGTPLLVAVTVLGLIGCWQYFRKNPQFLFLILLPGFIGLVVLLAVDRNIWPRFFFYVSGLALLVAVQGLWTTSNFVARLFSPSPDSKLGRWVALSMLTIIMLQSLRMLPPNYRHPKQDFLAAMQFVETSVVQNEPVVTVGMTILPYITYYRKPWIALVQNADMDRILDSNNRAWVLYCFPINLKSHHPQIFDRIQQNFEVVKSFRGTLGGGSVYVLTNREDSSPPPTFD